MDILVSRAQSGDLEAFGELYRQHRPRVLRLCFRMVHDWTAAEDLTQDIFLGLFKKIHQFRGGSKFTTWLYRYAVNHVLMQFRRKKPMLVDDTSLLDRAGVTPDLDAALDLQQAVQGLSDSEASIIRRHYILGYTYQEDASRLGCPEDTVKTRSNRAKKRLEKFLTAGAGRG